VWGGVSRGYTIIDTIISAEEAAGLARWVAEAAVRVRVLAQISLNVPCTPK